MDCHLIVAGFEVLLVRMQGINAILFFAPLIFKSLGTGQSSSLLGAVAVSPS